MIILGKMIDITGQTFGKLTVIDCAGKLDGKRYFWKCQCECGNIVTKDGSVLRSGNTKSCGCGKYDGLKKYNEQQSAETLIPAGTKFGKLQILKPIGYKPQYKGSRKNRMWYQCQCDCGNICEVNGNSLKNNHKISCGCVASKGELEIETILQKSNYLYGKEVILPELLQETGRALRFDFIVYENNGQINRIIEFDGRQHQYGPDTDYWDRSTTDTLEKIQERDNIKNQFCLKHNYKLVRIPYSKLGKITIADLFGNEYLIKGE